MEIEINDIKRECEIFPAPKGCYSILDNEGCFGFPLFVLFAPALTEAERACGELLCCPIVVCNEGYENISPSNIKTCAYLTEFRVLIANVYRGGYTDTIQEAAEYVIESFLAHEVAMTQSVKDYIEGKKYLSDVFLKKLANE